jgi:hypothetical protein
VAYRGIRSVVRIYRDDGQSVRKPPVTRRPAAVGMQLDSMDRADREHKFTCIERKSACGPGDRGENVVCNRIARSVG